jgi:hypothetical protein
MDRLNPRTSLDPDILLTANSDNRVPTQKAVKAYIDDSVTGGGGGGGGHRWGGGVDTTSDVIIDSTTSGLVLKDTNGHYWRVKINTSGVLTTTDLGTTKP